MQQRRIKLIFTASAWLKMHALVSSFSTEIGWHGIVERNENEFRVTDILVYPQEVTGATVNTDQNKYEKWLYGDEVGDNFDKIRLHGHSHVNMACSPSGTDMDHRNRVLADLRHGMYYIFLICNKQNAFRCDVYDTTDMTRYTENDIDLIVEGTNLGAFLKDAEGKVKKYIWNYQRASNFSTLNQSKSVSTSSDAAASAAPLPKTLSASALQR